MATAQQVEMRAVPTVCGLPVKDQQTRPKSYSVASTGSNQSYQPQTVVVYNNQQTTYPGNNRKGTYAESVRSFSNASAQTAPSVQSNPQVIYAVPAYPESVHSAHSAAPQQQVITVLGKTLEVEKGVHPLTGELVELEDEPEKPNKWIMLLWFLWNTFDLITDIVLGFEWFHGIKTQLSDTNDCVIGNNIMLKIFGVIMMMAGLVGYVCYLFDSYREYKGKKRLNADGCNCFRLNKLICEDLG